MHGSVWPLLELDKDLRKQDLQDALTFGNHKGASTKPESLWKLISKDAKCWKITKQHGHKSNGQMTSQSVLNTNKIWKPEEREELNEKPMRCRHGKAERDKEIEMSKENSLFVDNLGIQCYILRVMRLTSFQHYWSKVIKRRHWQRGRECPWANKQQQDKGHPQADAGEEAPAPSRDGTHWVKGSCLLQHGTKPICSSIFPIKEKRGQLFANDCGG